MVMATGGSRRPELMTGISSVMGARRDGEGRKRTEGREAVDVFTCAGSPPRNLGGRRPIGVCCLIPGGRNRSRVMHL
jgi:hypothetical protein